MLKGKVKVVRDDGTFPVGNIENDKIIHLPLRITSPSYLGARGKIVGVGKAGGSPNGKDTIYEVAFKGSEVCYPKQPPLQCFVPRK